MQRHESKTTKGASVPLNKLYDILGDSLKLLEQTLPLQLIWMEPFLSQVIRIKKTNIVTLDNVIAVIFYTHCCSLLGTMHLLSLDFLINIIVSCSL